MKQVGVARQRQSTAQSSTPFFLKELHKFLQWSRYISSWLISVPWEINNLEASAPVAGLFSGWFFVLYRKFWPSFSLQIRDRFSICFLIFPKMLLISIWIKMFTGKYYRDWNQVLRQFYLSFQTHTHTHKTQAY